MNASLVTTSVGSLNPKTPICFMPSAPISDAIKSMQEHETGCVLVTENDRLVGIVTERDILRKVVAREIDASSTEIKTIMSPEPDFLYADDSLAFALNAMSAGGSRKVTIVDGDGKPTGLITIEDILDYIIEKLNF